MPKPIIKVFLDVGSVYSYIAFELLCRYRHVWDMAVQFVPVVLGVVLKATGNQSPAAVAAKGAYMVLDIRRTCQLANIPFLSPPPNFGTATFNTLPALRVLVAVQQLHPQPVYEKLLRSMYTRVFSNHGRQPVLFDKQMLEDCCRSAGVDARDTLAIMQVAESEEVKAQLKAQTQEALALGMFGAPFIMVLDHPALPPGKNHFFGSDRLEQMAALMGKPWFGVALQPGMHLKSSL